MNRLSSKTLYALFATAIIFLMVSYAVHARPGGGQTHSSSHSSSSSSHSSSGSSSSLGSTHPGSSSSGSGSSSFPVSTGRTSGGGFGFLIFLFILIFVVIVLVVVAKQLKGPGGTPPPVQPDTDSNLAAAMAALRAADPNFSEVLFIDFVNTLYARAQEARGRGTVDNLAPYIDDPSRQRLLSLGSAATGLTEVAGVVLGTTKIVAIGKPHQGAAISAYFEPKSDDGQGAYMTVYFEANYTEKQTGGAQTSYYTEERWHFGRQAGVLSLPPGKIDAIHCPKCGGPLERTADGACPYCNTVVRGGEFHWFVIGIEVLDREVRGPQLTADTPEEGNDLPTVYQQGFQEAVARFQAQYTDFSWDKMNERVNYIFHMISQAWTALEWDKARPFETDNIFQMHRYWIEAYKAQNLRNVLDKIQVSKIEWVKVDQDAYYDSLTARIWASEIDCTIDQAGRVVCGSSTQPRAFTEYWTFIRTRGAKAVEHKDDHCPNCGAPLAVNMAGVCDYCGGKITSGDFDWVLSRIDQDEAYTG
jgi:predicted lipid-binding transport protein (Tim44 family)